MKLNKNYEKESISADKDVYIITVSDSATYAIKAANREDAEYLALEYFDEREPDVEVEIDNDEEPDIEI